MAKSRSQPVNLPGAQPLMNPLLHVSHCCTDAVISTLSSWGLLRPYLKHLLSQVIENRIGEGSETCSLLGHQSRYIL